LTEVKNSPLRREFLTYKKRIRRKENKEKKRIRRKENK